jgi:ribosomal protein S12 methylthiotransferase
MSTQDVKKVCLISLGCPKNLVDAELMLGFLKRDGFDLTVKPEEAEVLVVNTCSFIEGSKKESIDALLEAAEYKKTGKCKLLVATGCLSQRYGDAVAQEMPEVDLLLGTGEFDRLSGLLKDRLGTPFPPKGERVFVSARQILPDPDLPRILATPSHYSYLKVSEGCSHKCSFCIIPKIRGALKSRSMDSLVSEVETLVARGVKEFNLIAQDLNEYGRDLRDDSSLTELLSRLDKIPGDFWLRPLYMYPLLFSDRLMEVLSEGEHIVPYVDMPLQHINERVMLSMRRGSPGRYVRQLLEKLKKHRPDLAIRTTFIVGFPGETESEFQELYDFVREYEFDRVGVFRYSDEENTDAHLLSAKISEEIKTERWDRLMGLQRKISRKKNQALVGKTCRLLVEGPSEESEMVLQARLSTQAPEIDGVTYLSEVNARPGEFISARITEAHDYDLVASP